MQTKIIDFEVIQQSKDINPHFSYMNDFLTYDNIYNQIIKRTINLLINYKNLKDEYEWALVKIYNHLREVSYVKIDNEAIFDGLIMHKYNKSYEYVLKLCEFIWCELNISEAYGKSNFLDLEESPEKLKEFIQTFIKVFYREESFKNLKPELVVDISTIDFTKDWDNVHFQLANIIER